MNTFESWQMIKNHTKKINEKVCIYQKWLKNMYHSYDFYLDKYQTEKRCFDLLQNYFSTSVSAIKHKNFMSKRMISYRKRMKIKKVMIENYRSRITSIINSNNKLKNTIDKLDAFKDMLEQLTNKYCIDKFDSTTIPKSSSSPTTTSLVINSDSSSLLSPSYTSKPSHPLVIFMGSSTLEYFPNEMEILIIENTNSNNNDETSFIKDNTNVKIVFKEKSIQRIWSLLQDEFIITKNESTILFKSEYGADSEMKPYEFSKYLTGEEYSIFHRNESNNYIKMYSPHHLINAAYYKNNFLKMDPYGYQSLVTFPFITIKWKYGE